MKRIYEPEDAGELPDSTEIQPNVEITDGLRMHFHSDGVSFGLINSVDSQFSALISYDKARELMVEAAARYAKEKGQ